MKKKHKVRSLYSYKLLVPALVLYCAFFVLPTIMGFGYSFTDWRLDRPAIHFNGLKNFTRIFHDKVIVLAFWNTIEFTALTVLMKNGFGLILASLLNRKIRSRNLLRGIFYLPSILSAVAVGVVFTAMLYPEGPLNSFSGRSDSAFLQRTGWTARKWSCIPSPALRPGLASVFT
jgi:raffinose/stachyose/melibiose transport system permease protein